MADHSKQAARDWRFAGALKRTMAQQECDVIHLACGAELSVGHLYRLLQGRQQPSWATVCAIADYLGVSTEEFRYSTNPKGV